MKRRDIGVFFFILFIFFVDLGGGKLQAHSLEKCEATLIPISSLPALPSIEEVSPYARINPLQNIIDAVTLVIPMGNKVMFLQRGKEATSTGQWGLPGGKLEFLRNETLAEASNREMFEEMGILVEGFKVLHVRYHVTPEAVYRVFMLKAQMVEGGEPAIREPHKISNWGWFRKESLPPPYFANLENFFSVIFSKNSRI